MMSLYGGAGMGSNGLGMGAGGGMNPVQLLAMLRGNGTGQPPAGNPFQPGGAATPMSNYIGAPPGGGMGMQRPMMPPVAGNPAPQGMGAGMGGGGTAGLMQLLAQLKGGQTGVAPQQGPSLTPNDMAFANGAPHDPGAIPTPPMPPPGGAPAMAAPQAGGNMDWLRNLLASLQSQPGAGGMAGMGGEGG